MSSPYDLYRWGGDQSAISDSAKRGELLFNSSERAGCFQCHGGWNFSGGVRYQGGPPQVRGAFLNTAVTAYTPPNRGIFEHTLRAEDLGKFRAPTLRNIALTAPYMHDGSMTTLDEVVRHYEAGGRMNDSNKSSILRPFHLSDGERQDLIEFLKSLTDEKLLQGVQWGNPWQSGEAKRQ